VLYCSAMEEAIAVVIAAGLTVGITWWATSHHYYRQRWWERRAQAYSDLFASVAAIHHVNGHFISDAEGIVNMTEERKAALRLKYTQGKDTAELLALGAGLFVSKDAGEVMKRFLMALENNPADPNDYHGAMENDWVASKECIAALREEAQKDLKVKD